MPNELETYRQTLLDLYLRLPDTPCRVSRHDVHLVRQLWERGIPLTTAETALLLASVPQRGVIDVEGVVGHQISFPAWLVLAAPAKQKTPRRMREVCASARSY